MNAIQWHAMHMSIFISIKESLHFKKNRNM